MKVSLWPDVVRGDIGTPNEGCPSITLYLLEEKDSHPVMIVCPGGGYSGHAYHEGEPVARWLNSIGVSAAVLNYRVAPFKFPDPLHDAQRAIRTVRYNAREWRLDPNRVGILGFSAGGHLASTAGTHYDLGNLQAEDPIERESCRPDVMVLCYAVISLGSYGHEGSRISLLGEEPDPRLVQYLSNEMQVTEHTPSTFMWHTSEDSAVPAENSFLFAMALSRNKVPYELHVFEGGEHGLGLGGGTRETQVWTDLCESWLKARNFIHAYVGFSEYSKLNELLKHDHTLAILNQYWPEHANLPSYLLGSTIKQLVDIHLSTLSADAAKTIGVELAALNGTI